MPASGMPEAFWKVEHFLKVHEPARATPSAKSEPFIPHRTPRPPSRTQAGIALPMVIGASMILGITGTTAMIYSTSNVRRRVTSKADERAFSLARPVSTTRTRPSTTHRTRDAGGRSDANEQVENGTITWWGTLDTRRTPGRSRATEAPEPSRRDRRDPHDAVARASSAPRSGARTTRSGTTSTPRRRRAA